MPSFEPTSWEAVARPSPSPSAHVTVTELVSMDRSQPTAASLRHVEQQRAAIVEILQGSGLFEELSGGPYPDGTDLNFHFIIDSSGRTQWAWTGPFALFLPLPWRTRFITFDLTVRDAGGSVLGEYSARGEVAIYGSIYDMLRLGPGHTVGGQEQVLRNELILELVRQAAASGSLASTRP